MMRGYVINNEIHRLITLDELTIEMLNSKNSYCIEYNGSIYPIARNMYEPGILITNEDISIYSYWIIQIVITNIPFVINNVCELPDSCTEFSNISEWIEFNESNRDIQNEMITTTDSDNIFRPVVTESDSVEMRMLKEAIASKSININKYESRFNGKFQNDKRLLNKNTITLDKLKTFAEALDLTVELIIRDKSGNISNPMDREFREIITSEGDN